MSQIAQTVGERLRPVGIRLGLLASSSGRPPELQEPPTFWSVMRSATTMALVLGVIIALRRTPAEGVVWAALLIVAAVPAALAKPWVDRRRTVTSAVVDFVRIAPLFGVSFAALLCAWDTNASTAELADSTVAYGALMAAFSAGFDWRDRQQTLT